MLHNGLAGLRVAIANRGEIAVRIAATCRRLSMVPVLLIGEPDLDGFAARQIGRVEVLGEAGAELDPARVVAAAVRAGADFLHPGYGFLSERPELAEACAAAGLRFVGPSAATLWLCFDKVATREAAASAGVPVLPASLPLGPEPDTWVVAARQVGYPLLVKPVAAGGGRGLRRVADASALTAAVMASAREGEASGAGQTVYLERELTAPRHIEVQVAGDGRRALAIGDRDCSVQRRHQKVIEEAPAPGLTPELRRIVHEYARAVATAVGLHGIATCEFLVGADGTIAFLEVNPRIQVEHPVTEMVTGIDLVAWQLRLAAGAPLPDAVPPPRGHAIEARVYAEDPAHGFLPAPGRLTTVAWPVGPGIRVDAGYASGDVVPSAYDAMLGKVIVHAPDRATALAGLRAALLDTIVAGVPTNLPWLLDLLATPAVEAGTATTETAARVPPRTVPHRPAVLGAVAHALDRSRGAGSSPWSAIGPFRLAGSATLVVHGEGWQEAVQIERRGESWFIGDEAAITPYAWWRDEAGVWTVAAGDTVVRLAVNEAGDGLEVAGAGGRWLVALGHRPVAGGSRQQQRADGRVRAPMPGRILEVSVAPGQRVEAEQPLVLLTAMKMELSCVAPAAGSVSEVRCAAGDQVEAHQVLVELRLDPAAADA
jgi:acetyl/propionyl-CoA carboxylase alpha subunit